MLVTVIEAGSGLDWTGPTLVVSRPGRAAAFTRAYAADGAWGELFGRAAGFLGTELYCDAGRADRFLTIDRWQNEEDWQSFLRAFSAAYESLDAQLEGLAVAERSLFEGSS